MSTDAAVAWLREQITARLATARKALPVYGDAWHVKDADGYGGRYRALVYGKNRLRFVADVPSGSRTARHIARNDPQDVIARCEAEMAILDEHSRALDGKRHPLAKCWGCLDALHGLITEDMHAQWPCKTVHLVASGYRHKPGYAEHWPA